MFTLAERVILKTKPLRVFKKVEYHLNVFLVVKISKKILLS